MTISNTATLDFLLERNQHFIEEYKASDIIKFITSSAVQKKEARECMLDAIQTLSNFFQKTILLRSVLTDNYRFSHSALVHLKEEFCHHEELMAERNYKPPIWDAILESTCSWFAWKMFNTNDEEKVILIHLVLESSANAFFQIAYQVMQQYDDLNYFKVHAAVDEQHEHMGVELLTDLSSTMYQRLIEIQYQGWKMIIAACNRIAALSLGGNVNSHA